ncbi:Major facilitator superfamily transporter [Desulfonema limicola]|uniref:Major facilitator superfamily transporter n=1 Tax=Desulfonema limicola TaxID=45656 RepID=A0A975GF09_9BACT|nr:MFS transporter [Desulfonema limicola]QTA78777.1 Major facilitator superfamily transporter [Desulfonema limicola]
MKNRLISNLWKLYIIRIIRWFLLFMPVIVLFFKENGLTMSEVLLIQSIFSIGVIVFEIPSGYFGDIIGRKASIAVGSVLSFIGFLIYSLSNGFWGFLSAELILGFGVSFISGSDSALLYDTLAAIGMEGDYLKIESRMISIGNFSEGVAGIIGGFLATITLRTPLLIETIIIFFAIPLSITLYEPERIKPDNTDGNFKTILKIFRYAICEHQELKLVIIYSGFLGSSTLTMVWFIQPYFGLSGLPLSLFGLVWAVLQFSVGIFTLYAKKLEKKLGRFRVLILLCILSFTGYTIVGLFQSLWAVPFILIFYFVRGIGVPLLREYINSLITSDIRATILSINSMAVRIVFAIAGPVIGCLNDQLSLPDALLMAGFIFVVPGILSLWFLNNIVFSKNHKILQKHI